MPAFAIIIIIIIIIIAAGNYLCIISHHKNLARPIANRSLVSCAHNTSMASILTQLPWNLGYGSLKVIGNGNIG